MVKKTKRLIALLLSLLMTISLIPATGFNVEAAAKPELTKKSVSIVIGEISKIKVKNVPKEAKITYKSAKKNIAMVSKKGKVKGIKDGSTEITVSVKKNLKTIKLTYKVTVRKPVLLKSTLSLISGSTANIFIKNKPKKATYTYLSGNSKVATVDKKGKVTAKAEGTTVIKVKARTAKKTYCLSCKVTVKPIPMQTCTITFDSNGGSLVESQTVEKNAKAVQPDSPVRIGYIFNGWYTTADGGQKFDFNTAVTENITLYANWTAIPNEESITYTTIFDSNGGSPVESQTVQKNTLVSCPESPSHSGYSFDGWYTAKSGGQKFDFSKAVTGNITLYAHWNVISSDGNSSGSSSSGTVGGGSSSGVGGGGGSSGGGGGGSSSGGGSGSGSSSGNNVMSHQAWISELLPAAGIETGPDGITGTAQQYNVIDSGFSPDAITTEDFAVETAIRALGFSYNDLADCFQIANDVGLFTGTPSAQNLTLAKKERIIAKTKEISAPVKIPQKPEGEVVFSEKTQILDDTDLSGHTINPATTSGDKGTLTLTSGKTYAKGGYIILPASGEYPNGLAQKIVSVSKNTDNTVTVETEYPTLDEVMGKEGRINISGSISGSEEMFIPNNELLEKFNKNTRSTGYSRGATKSEEPFSLTWGPDGIKLAVSPSSGLGFYGEVAKSWPDFNYDADIEWGAKKVNSLYLTVSENMAIEGGLKWEKENNWKPTHIKIGKFKIPLAGTVPIAGQIINAEVALYLTATIEGSVGFTWRFNYTAGVQYINGHMRGIGRTGSNFDYKPFEFKGKVGPELAVKLNLLDITIVDIGLSGGLGIYANMTWRELSSFCIDSKFYCYFEIWACKECIINDFGLPERNFDILNEANSPVKWYHFEGTGKEINKVPKCTYGNGSLKGIVKEAVTNGSVPDFNVKAVMTNGDGSSSSTDAIIHQDGSFEFTNLMRGIYTIIITAGDYQTYEQTGVSILAGQETDMGIIHLIPTSAQKVYGFVKDLVTKTGIKGATVTFCMAETVNMSTETVDDGSFIITDLPQGTYTVTVTASNYESMQQTNIEILPGQDIRLDTFFLKTNSGAVIGSVRDFITGNGVDGATVTLQTSNMDAEETDTSETVTIDGSFIFENVASGTYTLTVAADGYETYQRTDIEVQAGQTTNMGIIGMVSNDESGTGSITGYIYDSVIDSGLSGATVTLYRGNGTEYPVNLQTTTAVDGKYEFTDVAFGNYTITVHKNQYADGFRSITVMADKVDSQNVTLIPLDIGEGSSGFSFYSQLSPEAKTVYNAILDSTNRNNLKTGGKIYVWESNSFTFRKLDIDPETGEEIYGENWNYDYEYWWQNYVFSGAQDYMNAVDEAYKILYLDHPEIFWTGCIEYFWGIKVLENNGSWRVMDLEHDVYEPGRTYRSNVWVKFTILEPWNSGRSISSDESTISSQVDAITRKIDKSGSRYEQLLQVHDWLTQNNAYNTSANNDIPWSALSALSTSYHPVCAGYAKAFKMLCDKLNIPCVLAGGMGISDNGQEGHMWNCVQMEDGKWYAVDVTWDDPVGGSGNQSGFERHDYFLAGSGTVIDGWSFASSHQIDVVNKPNGSSFVYPSLSTDAYGLITIHPAAGGTVEATPARGGTNAVVTLTISLDSGYELDSLIVKDKNGHLISMLQENETQFRFTMPSNQVTITPVFKIKAEENPISATQ